MKKLFVTRINISHKKTLVKRYEQLGNRLRIYKDDPTRANQNHLWDGFGLIHNRVISLYEILDFYFTNWEKFLQKNPTISDDVISKEIFGRITTVTTWCFVSVFSAIEFIIKNIIKDSNEKEFSQIKKDLLNDERVYLEDIIKKSVSLGIVKKKELAKWLALIKLRNIFVHNNGFPDTNKLYAPVKKHFTVFKKNEMIKGPYDNFYEPWSKNYRSQKIKK